MPSTQIILTENVPGLGAEADVVKVRRGYARNYLLPRGKAYEVTPATLRELDNLKKKRAEREARELNDAEEFTRRIAKLRVTFTLATGESGKAFGSITAQDIVTRLKNELGNEIDRHKIALDHQTPPPAQSLRKNTVRFSGEKKKRNKWRLNRPRGQSRSLAENRATGPAEAGRRKMGEKFFPVRPQVLRRIFTGPLRTASRRSRVYSAQC